MSAHCRSREGSRPRLSLRAAPRGLPALLALLVGISACDGGSRSSSGPSVLIDTVGGVVHVTNEGPGLWRSSKPWGVDTSRALRIGVVSGPAPYVFGAIAGVVVGPRGRVYVGDAQADQVRVFSAAGKYLATFGRKGEGPGEFQNISGLGPAPGGGVAALDGALGRVTVFDSTGVVERTFRLARPYEVLEYDALVRFDTLGRFYDRTGLEHELGIDSLALVRYGAKGRVEDTTLVAAYRPATVTVQKNGRPYMSMPVPFSPHVFATVGPDGRIWVTRGQPYELAGLTRAGDTVLVVARSVAPMAVTAAERDSAVARLRAQYRYAAGHDPRELPSIPAYKPPIDGLIADEAGDLWVARPRAPDAATSDWDVFEPGGRFLGTIRLPSMRVLYIGRRHIAGVLQDSLGVEQVEVLPLDRGT